MSWAHAQEPPPDPHPGAPCWQHPRPRGPSGSGSTASGPRGPGDKRSGGLWGTKVAGLAAVPASPCIRSAAALLPQQRSPASAAASRGTGLGPGARGAPQPAAPPHTAPGLPQNIPGCPHTPPPPWHRQPHACLCLSPREKRGCPHRSQCCPMPTQRPELGGFSTWRGPQAMEVTSCWEKNPVWGHRCTRVVQRGSITSSNTPAPHFWANIQTRVVF